MEKDDAILLWCSLGNITFNRIFKMKLARIGNPGKEKPIIVDKDNNYRDVSSVIKDFNSDNLNFETLEKLNNIKPEDFPILE